MSEAQHLSKFLSFVLRHEPGSVGLTLDANGWVSVELLLRAFAAHGKVIDRETLERIVRESDKQRFALSPDGAMIRANQGHSVDVDLGYVAMTPPDVLYHGTVERFIPSIRAQGLLRGERHHVHLSATPATALVVGQRRGKPVLLEVDAAAMNREGHEFFRSENGVWLTEHVPARFLRFDPVAR